MRGPQLASSILPFYEKYKDMRQTKNEKKIVKIGKKEGKKERQREGGKREISVPIHDWTVRPPSWQSGSCFYISKPHCRVHTVMEPLISPLVQLHWMLEMPSGDRGMHINILDISKQRTSTYPILCIIQNNQIEQVIYLKDRHKHTDARVPWYQVSFSCLFIFFPLLCPFLLSPLVLCYSFFPS